MNTTFHILFVPSFQIMAGILFLFGFYPRFIFPSLASASLSDRITRSVAGTGGIIILMVYLAAWLRMVDFVSFVFLMILLPVFRILVKHRFKRISSEDPEDGRWILRIIERIERFKVVSLSGLKLSRYLPFKRLTYSPALLAFLIALAGGVLRMQPVRSNIAPFNFTWFDTLDRVKNTMLGARFSDSTDPAGLDAFVYFMSTVLQLRPELILNLLGVLVTVMLSFMVYKIVLEITDGSETAAFSGLLLFALMPMFILPVSVVKQISTGGMNLAVLFAASAFLNFLRYLEKPEKDYLILCMLGIIAAGLTDYFILVIVLPFLFLPGLFILSAGKKEKLKVLSGLVAGLCIPQVFYFYSCYITNTSFSAFVKTQLFKPSEFSYFPDLVLSLESLAYLYLILAAILLLVSVALKRVGHVDNRLIALIAVITMLFSVPFLSALKLQYDVIDVDQLTGFYSFLIAVFLSIFLSMVIKVFPFEKVNVRIPSAIPVAVLAMMIIIAQKDRLSSRELYHHLTPKEFFEAYYQIVSERLPYTYAIVAPDYGTSLAKNRHYFINYNYLLNDYAARDSLYQHALRENDKELQKQTKLPASVFIFVDNSPHTNISSQVLYDAQNTMNNVLDWIKNYELKRNKLLRIYFRSANVSVFEIVNEIKKSDTSDLLFNIRNKEN